MNWKIGFFIWLKGIGIFAMGCILLGLFGMFNGGDLRVLGVSIAIVVVASIISCPAIPLYALNLYLIKTANLGHKDCMAFIIIITAPLAVGIADVMLYLSGENLEGMFSYLFWIPLLFCIVSILISRKGISLYLHPGKAIEN